MLALALVLVAAVAAVWYQVTQPLFSERTPRIVPPVDRARLAADVARLCTRFAPRDARHPENLARAASFLADELRGAGATVTEQVFQADGRKYRNVLASFGPEDGPRVVVGAHYDAFGGLPGADDNASGVAGLLELARLLGGAGAREAPFLARRVDLAAYAIEEPPYFRTAVMGSAVHARWLKDLGVTVKAMLALEMIGCFTETPGSQRFPSAALKPLYPSRGNFVTVVGELFDGGLARRVKTAMRDAAALPVESINAPRSVPGVDFSDNLSFWNAEMPAVMITDTAFYRNDRYHTERDTPDSLDYARMAMVVQGVYRAVVELAGP